jgi:hypothetical protein
MDGWVWVGGFLIFLLNCRLFAASQNLSKKTLISTNSWGVSTASVKL